VIDFIVRQGIRHVFCVPGGGAMHLNDSLWHDNRVIAVSNLHEQASAMAAETYAKVTRNLGCALVTTGPGGTNALTGLAGAWLDSTPCLFISGQAKRSDLKGDSGVKQMGVQEVDIVSVVSSLTNTRSPSWNRKASVITWKRRFIWPGRETRAGLDRHPARCASRDHRPLNPRTF
jgi:acetolactate synthase-1/2/3 large subunit